jgi:hypothetical protein
MVRKVVIPANTSIRTVVPFSLSLKYRLIQPMKKLLIPLVTECRGG